MLVALYLRTAILSQGKYRFSVTRFLIRNQRYSTLLTTSIPLLLFKQIYVIMTGMFVSFGLKLSQYDMRFLKISSFR
jgi:hypothetical protein